MKRFIMLLVVAALALGARADVATSQNYAITVSSIDGGGGRGSVGPYEHHLIVAHVAGHTVAPQVYANDLGFGALLNSAPIANPDLRSHPPGSAVDILTAALFGNDEDPDGDALSLVRVDGTSAGGATISVSGGTIHYAPPVGVTGTDHFSYIVQDVNGDTATAMVTLAVAPAAANQPLNTLAMFEQEDGKILLRFRDAAGRQEYKIEFTHDLNDVWEPLVDEHAGADGVVEVLIDPSQARQTFFRALTF